ncbi:hypothetical protein Vadar_007983 [Vaccinium darrowii]|uniref:Uncharacterized protein n=1 Tax=Vaccinium darrowii TaxID=229202 RepID=A0ACB7ZIK5_9ERIC|nr:hypothetical protein Vadar_007983 [Vaccinium darrowii]
MLVVSQLNSDYGSGESRMLKYLSHVLKLQEDFKKVEFWHIGRGNNAHADALAALGSACSDLGGSRSIILGDIPTPSFEPGQEDVMWVAPTGPSWMDPLVAFLRTANRLTGSGARRPPTSFRQLDSSTGAPTLVLTYESSVRRRGTGRTPFSLAYGMEAVLPLAATAPTDRTEDFHPATNEEHIASELNHVEDLRDEAHIRHAAYQQEVARG